MWGDPDTGLILTYRMPENSAFTYRTTSDFTQNMDVMGQKMKITADEMFLFTISPKGMKGKDMFIDVTVDSMLMDISTPQGSMNADVGSVIGKTFEMVVSPLGKEIEIIGAEEIKYDMGPEGERSVESNFQNVFNDLPGRPVVVGDTWTQVDTIRESSSDGSTMNIMMNSTHTLAGFETIGGEECAKITTVFTGKMKGKGMQQGMEFTVGGTTEGTETWYFNYKKGHFVEMTAEVAVEGTIDAVNNPGISIPMTREMTIKSKLLKIQKK
jgi:hypothetical protein